MYMYTYIHTYICVCLDPPKSDFDRLLLPAGRSRKQSPRGRGEGKEIG